MYLETINSPADIQKLSQKEISELSSELRQKILSVVGKNGGHLASNLGAVELTIALHRVFSTPKDAIIFDVSHQCYAHKLLTGRLPQFDTVRQHQGLSGFTNIEESEHDFFTSGHASTSISSALGLLTAWEKQGHDGKVVAVIGDGALTGGLAFEGLEHAGQLSKNLIVILNDNQMSIDHNTGSVSRYLSRLTVSSRYQSFRYKIDRAIDKIPYINKSLEKLVFRFKRSIKGLMLTNNLFVDLGFEYVGPLNGHNEMNLEHVLRRVKKLHRPVVVHVVTKKGKGYSYAEETPENFHGVGPFDVKNGVLKKSNKLTFTESFSNSIVSLGRKNEKIVAITAAMAQGTGLSKFERKFPARFFDVGIAEEHAVTFAGGLARGGMIPVCCIYSTFIQRSVDQIIHDISLQKLHAIFVLDRAGAVPGDGATHQGIFDIALFRPVPEAIILSPVSDVDLHLCLRWAVNSAASCVFIRYPKLSCPEELDAFRQPVSLGKGIFVPAADFSNLSDSEFVSRTRKKLVVTTGGMFTEVQSACKKYIMENSGLADIFVLRFIKPFDETYFKDLVARYDEVILVEDGVKTGGISEYLEILLLKNDYKNIKILAFEEKFYSHGTREEVLSEAGLGIEDIYKALI
ncbi:MAG: 1-deoxy-D-xylulose-5-phosphate synthase [Treponema sp.]|nr:1-deoxy-D-xylulose-5-phosphate synthase [Treponema sp.]